ncbi:MAG: 3-phosphoshikimate 1-carboxyvinyltransferase [Nitrospirota bacterium]|nr:3-phosphoshikimate 1-carboxyvinyltransferase [Nitrospirota bacterium]
MSDLVIHGSRGLRGEITPPGDKSLSHRAVMFSSIAEGETQISGFLAGEDTLNTARAMRMLGVQIDDLGAGRFVVHGKGLRGLSEPAGVLDLGNSGTGMRLLAGLLAGQDFFSVLTGDQYLVKRPMGRIADPLRTMGAAIDGRTAGKFAPLAIRGAGKNIKAIDYRSPVASAQVKSAVLLCGLYAAGATSVSEPHKSRDHTERMLRFFGVDVREDGLKVSVQGNQALRAAGSLVIPADISSAAFFLVAATIVPGSDLIIRNVGINPTRTGILDVLTAMGADIILENRREQAGEPVADLRVRHRALRATEIKGDIIPRLIDEVPVLAVAAACAEGTTVIRDAEELRVKESDRIATMAAELRKLGADVRERPDGMEIAGTKRLRGNLCESHGDHRIAMSLAVAGLAAEGVTTVRDTEWIETSFPGFAAMLENAVH